MKILAINGSYRRGQFTDQVLNEVLSPARENGDEVEVVQLTDAHIEFCSNCRKCMNDSRDMRFGECVIGDEMKDLLAKIDSADAFIIISPTNIGNVTAITKRFIERIAPATYWPWKNANFPVPRVKGQKKKALVITSCAMPGLLLKILAPNVLTIMKDTAKYLGFNRVIKGVFGLVGQGGNFTLSERERKKARKLGRKLL